MTRSEFVTRFEAVYTELRKWIATLCAKKILDENYLRVYDSAKDLILKHISRENIDFEVVFGVYNTILTVVTDKTDIENENDLILSRHYDALYNDKWLELDWGISATNELIRKFISPKLEEPATEWELAALQQRNVDLKGDSQKYIEYVLADYDFTFNELLKLGTSLKTVMLEKDSDTIKLTFSFIVLIFEIYNYKYMTFKRQYNDLIMQEITKNVDYGIMYNNAITDCQNVVDTMHDI